MCIGFLTSFSVPLLFVPHQVEHLAHPSIDHQHALERPLTLESPVPRIFKSENLGRASSPFVLFENDVVVRVRVEGRVKVNQVYRLAGQVFPHDLEIIAVKQFFHRSSLQGFEGFRFTSIYVIQYSEYYGFTVTRNTDTPDYVKYEGESRTV